MYLNSTSDLIRVNVASAIELEAVVSWGAADDGAPPAITDFDSTVLAAITGTGNTTLLTGVNNDILKPTAISLYNDHATDSSVVYVDYFDGTNATKLFECLLLAGELMLMNEAGTWFHYDANGALYPSIGNAATQAEMEAGTATDRYVTPQGVNWHPGAAKFWVLAGITGNIIASHNVTSLTDNGVGDVTVTLATDFSSANWCAQVTVEMTATTYAVANARTPHVRFGGQAAGTLRCDCIDGTATTQLVKDPTFWHMAGYGDQ